MLTPTPLSTIIALARAGALDRAWGEFSAAGYDRQDEPAALTVKGRLLKDHALRAADEAERRRYYLLSAEAYRRAAALQSGTYPLINAATLSLLSGDRAQAEEIASEVLARIEAEPDEPETPYWRAATEAEALLLLGRRDEARAALEAAVAAAPRAWEDHASTLRQFLAIQDLLGGDMVWLDVLRPPHSLHVAADAGPGDAEISAETGFGFGGLAAGAEIATAEALLARGAEYHVVLPCGAEPYAAAFVDPHGVEWRARFEAALSAADSVRCLRPLSSAPGPEGAALARLVAHGAALLNAERLMGSASSDWTAPAAPGGLALLAIRVGGSAGVGFGEQLAAAREALAGASEPAIAPHLNGEAILAGYGDCAAAAAAARAVHKRLREGAKLQIGGHYGLIERVSDPFSGELRPAGPGVDIVTAIAGATPPGSICVSDDFAAVLAATDGVRGEVSPVGELGALDGGPAIGLYALRPS